MSKLVFLVLFFLSCISYKCYAQVDSTVQNLHQFPQKNLSIATNGVNQYAGGITNKINGQDSLARGLQQKPTKYVTDANSKVNQYNASINKRTTQADNSVEKLQQVPAKYVKDVDNKIDKYNSRVNARTEKTLQRLSKWENKIQPVLQQANPQAAQKLFGNGQLTFTVMLQKYESGEAMTTQYQTQYNAYNDKVTTQMKYLEQQKGKLDSSLVKPVADANSKVAQLNKEDNNSAALQQLIKQRQKQLTTAVIQYMGSSPYLGKIDKESFYYVQTVKNYKQILSDPEQAEKTATDIINKMPAYQNFLVRNSQLASLFGVSANGGGTDSSGSTDTAGLSGLQTKAGIQSEMQSKISSGGPGAQQAMSQSIDAAQTQIAQIKNQLSQLGGSGGGSSSNTAPNFNPNMQKTKTLWQRLVFGTNIQTTRSTTYFPATSDIGLSLGYKLTDKLTIGVGVSYNMGWGTDISHINISGQGVGLRSFIDSKLKVKGNISITGGFEMNYVNSFSDFKVLQNYSAWQQSALIGLSKEYKVGNQTGNMQLLWDFLSYEQVPRTSPIVFRTGYSF